jgi:hypothetical protein
VEKRVNREPVFASHVKRMVERALKRGCSDFNELVKKLQGVYPTEARDALNSLGIDLPFVACAAPSCPRSELPVPHPGDSSWRFSDKTAKHLADRCINATRSGQTIALLGTPEVLLRLRNYGLERNVFLVDRDPLVITALKSSQRPNEELLHADLSCADVPTKSAGCVLVDPPWYLEQFRCFTWVASRISCLGASLLLPLPGIGTRPGMGQERRSLQRWLHQLGYAMSERVSGALEYDSPPFEKYALRAAGIPHVDTMWRSCDLAVATLREMRGALRPHGSVSNSWLEFTFGDVRLRVLTTDHNSEDVNPELISLIPGDVLPSVSARHPVRPYVRLWTSGNRVFGCKSPGVLAEILATLNNECCRDSLISATLRRTLSNREKASVHNAVEQLNHLLWTEQHEKVACGSEGAEIRRMERRAP